MFSQLDNDMRAWLASVANRSPAGEWIFSNKVAPKLKTADKHIKKRIGLEVSVKYLNEEGALQPYPGAAVAKKSVQDWLIRVTKGMLRKFYPDYDYRNEKLRCVIPTFNPKNVAMIHGLQKLCKHDRRGVGIFDFWHGRMTDHPGWVWIYVFFGNACCVVMHARDIPNHLASEFRE